MPNSNPHIDEIAVGSQVTECLYSDAHSFTVVRKTAKAIFIKMDNQEIDRDNWKPDITPGGFSGHCNNDWSQKWIVSANPDAGERMVRTGRDGKLSRKARYILGSHPHYDHNF